MGAGRVLTQRTTDKYGGYLSVRENKYGRALADFASQELCPAFEIKCLTCINDLNVNARV
jgi:hypothetical protein